MIVLYTLAVLWAIGTFLVAAYPIFDDWMIESGIGKFIYFCVITPIWVLLGLGPFVLIKHESGPELTTLLKSEWQCGQSHTQTMTTIIMVGKVPVPQVQTHTVCDVYVRK